MNAPIKRAERPAGRGFVIYDANGKNPELVRRTQLYTWWRDGRVYYRETATGKVCNFTARAHSGQLPYFPAFKEIRNGRELLEFARRKDWAKSSRGGAEVVQDVLL